MAIARINKLEIIGLGQDKDKILALLQKLGRVQLMDIREAKDAPAAQAVGGNINLLEIEEAISFLASFKEQTGFLKGMVTLKPLVYQQELSRIIANFDYQGLLKQLSDLRNHLRIIHQHKERLEQERHLLFPWRKLKVDLEQICYTQNCGILLGVLNRRDYPNLWQELKREDIDLFCESVNQDEANTYLVILYVREEFERLETVLKKHHFNFVTLSRHKGTVQDRLLEINRDALVLQDQIQDAKDKIADLAKQQFQLMVAYDYLANIRRRQEADNNLGKQQFTFSLKGWARQRDTQLIEQELKDKFQDLAMFVSPAKEDEDVPVILENKRLIQPFEFITGIYGMPKYHELDPTPFLAPFFFLYFGFCVSDVGYGFTLALISWLILKKIKMGPQGTKFFRLFFFCGISTIIIGALTGGWFGNLFDLLAANSKIFLPLKRFKDSLIILDPMKEPTKLLGIALSLGIIQVWFGNIVAAIGNIKNRRYLDIFLDQIPMLTLLFGLTGLGLIFLKLFAPGQVSLFKYATLVGAVALILTQGRSEKGRGAQLFYGIYNLYNALSGYLSDILSYSRLWALGLVTGVMANTINLISIQFSQILISILPFINKISLARILVSSFFLAIIFIAGHLVSFLMNLLGAFVHPVRLQFVEFFSKFFKSGGVSFKPFKVETKYINIS